MLTVYDLDYVVEGRCQVFVGLCSEHDADDPKLDQRWSFLVQHCQHGKVAVRDVHRQIECFVPIPFHLVDLLDELDHGVTSLLCNIKLTVFLDKVISNGLFTAFGSLVDHVRVLRGKLTCRSVPVYVTFCSARRSFTHRSTIVIEADDFLHGQVAHIYAWQLTTDCVRPALVRYLGWCK